MAQNDMEVIMYKILRYLYECMKTGKRPELPEYSWESKLFTIPKEYWCQIIEILIDEGLVKGFRATITKGGTIIQLTDQVKITYAGVCFLHENSAMQKVKNLLGEAFDITLSGIIGSIL